MAISVKLGELQEKLDELKKKDGISKSRVVRDLLEIYFEKLEETGRRHSDIISALRAAEIE